MEALSILRLCPLRAPNGPALYPLRRSVGHQRGNCREGLFLTAEKIGMLVGDCFHGNSLQSAGFDPRRCRE